MEKMNERIVKLIDTLQIKKSDFADKIVVSQAYVSQMCSGVRTPSDRTISDICREYSVNRAWLEEGVGDMFAAPPPQGVAAEVQAIIGHDNPFAVAVISTLLQMPKSWWEAWEAEYDKVVSRINEKEGNG